MEISTLAPQKPERLVTKDFILLMISSLGTAFCNFIFFTALPLYARAITGSDVYSGLMLTVYSIAALVARPVAGVLSDRFGRVKLLIFGAAVCVIACALYGITTAVLLLLAIRVFNGIGFGVQSTCAGAAAADVIPKERMAEGIGYFSLYSTIASALGPFVAIVIVGKGELRDFKTLFFVAAGLCLMSLICNCCLTYERRRKKELAEKAGPEAPSPAAAGEAVRHEVLPKTFAGFEYAVFLPMAVLILLFFGQTSINTFLTLLAASRGLGNVGLYFTVSSVALFLSRFAYSKLMDRRGADILIIPGIIGLAVCTFLIPFVHSTAMLCVIAVPMGFANGAVYPSINSILFLRCSPQRRGTASAAYFAAIDVGFAIGGIMLGIVASNLGYSAVYWVAAGLIAAGLVLYVAAVAERRRKKHDA